MEYLGRPTIQVHCRLVGPDSGLVIIEDSGKSDSSDPIPWWQTFELHYAYRNGRWRFTEGKVRGKYDEVLNERLPAELEKYFAEERAE